MLHGQARRCNGGRPLRCARRGRGCRRGQGVGLYRHEEAVRGVGCAVRAYDRAQARCLLRSVRRADQTRVRRRTADLVILGGGGLETLIKQGKVSAKGVDVARSMIGLAVAKGAPQPDISTPDKFKAVLLAAKSVAYTDAASGGASGAYLGKLFDRMGLTDVLKPKAKLAAGGPNGYAGTFVAKGEAEIA